MAPPTDAAQGASRGVSARGGQAGRADGAGESGWLAEPQQGYVVLGGWVEAEREVVVRMDVDLTNL